MSQGREPPVTETARSEQWGEGSREEGILVLRWVQAEAPNVTALSSARLTVGRDATCGVRIEGSQVSRQHAEICLVSGEYLVSDLSSKNGLFHNGKRITTAVLRPGDVLRVGDRVAVAEEVRPDGLSGFGCLADGFWGGSLLRRTARRAKQAAGELTPLVVQGETGTGKERLARAVHEWSGRRGPFLAVNCAAYTVSTANAELFGYRRGAFTGAEQAHLGHIRAADGGSLLLDEIADLSLETQAALLRAVERREVLPLGETRPVPVDVRFIAATQAPLADAVAAGRFRADLRARLEGFVVEIPALRARRADIYPLFKMFFEGLAGALPAIDARAVESLCLYPWPLNVRELQAATQRLVSLYRNEPEIRPSHFEDVGIIRAPGARAERHAAGSEAPTHRKREAYEPDEVNALLAAVARHRGNLASATRELGLTRSKGYRILLAAKRRGSAARGP